MNDSRQHGGNQQGLGEHKLRGIYERRPGSKIWWIRYAEATGRIRREKAGTKGAAIKLYQKRKTEILQGRKLPENLRAPMVGFAELAKDALVYSKTLHRDDGALFPFNPKAHSRRSTAARRDRLNEFNWH